MCRSYCIPRRDGASLLLPLVVAGTTNHNNTEETTSSSVPLKLLTKVVGEEDRNNDDSATVMLSESLSCSFGDDDDDECESNLNTSPPSKRRVSFGHVQIRRYPIILGDNPSVPTGAPITIDWTYDELPTIEFDHFESTRIEQRRNNNMYTASTRRRPQFKNNNLILSHYCREKMLLRLGYSLRQQRDAEREVAKIQKQRLTTLTRCSKPGLTKMEEMYQSVKRKVQRRLSSSTSTASSSCGGIGSCSSSIDHHQNIITIR